MAAVSNQPGASNFGEWLQLAVWDIKALFGDQDAKSHAEALREVNAQATPLDREIYRVVESEVVEGPRIPIFSDLADTLGNSIKGIGGLVKNIPIYFLVALLFVGGYLLLMGKQGKKVL